MCTSKVDPIILQPNFVRVLGGWPSRNISNFFFFFESGGYKICLKEEMQIRDVKDSHPKLHVMGTMTVRVLEQAELSFLHV